MTDSAIGTVTILMVDDDRRLVESLRYQIDAEADLHVVGTAGDGDEAVAALSRLGPDVVLMDVRMPGRDGISATAHIKAVRPRTRVLVLTTFDLDDYVVGALEAGADGFLLKRSGRRQICDGIRLAAAGDALVVPRRIRALVRQVVPARHGELLERHGLTARELDVLVAVAEGCTNAEIGDRLGLTVNTVKTHLTALFAKLHLTNRAQAVAFAYRERLVLSSHPPDPPG